MNTVLRRGLTTYRAALLLVAAVCLHGTALHAAEGPSYTKSVSAILEKHCYECHGPDDRKGGLRLSNEADARLGGDSHVSALAPDDSGVAPLMRRITSDDEKFRMPQKGPRVSPEEIAILKAWIEAGATFGDSSVTTGASPAKPVFWSFMKPEQPAPPAVDGTWGDNAIDAFVLQAMKSKGLNPSPEADRYTLIRRLSLDLRGLPPTPEEVERFVADPAPNAYEALVEDFLRSPHYGERMAINWLDVARYADTNGYEKDRPRSIWPYRDWVINAFNADMPFDRFVIEQMAGDLLPSPTLEQRIATGFFRNEMLNEEGGIDVAEFRYKNVVDRTNTISTALLGLTMNCAQCHSHKYDPISQREYYQLFAFLNNTDDVTLEVPDPAVTKKREEQLARIADLKASLCAQFPVDEFGVRYASFQSPVARSADQPSLPVEDGIVRVAGSAPDKNTTVLAGSIGPGRVTGLRLSVLPGAKGPGRADNGNFVLSEILAYRLVGPDTRSSLAFASAESSFAQATYAATDAIDGKLETGWAVGGAPDGPKAGQWAKFRFAEPIELAAPLSIEVHLEQQHGASHTLGDFRLEAIYEDARPAGQTDEQRRALFFDQEYNAWSTAIQAKARPWANLTPIKMETQKFTTLKRLADDSILATGELPNNDVYDLALRTDESHVTALRLEVLPHNSLPGGGPGRGVILSEGDFLLTEVKISAAPWNDPEKKTPLTISNATESFADGDKTAAKTLDGRADTGWSIKGGEGKPHSAVFAFEQPAGFPGGTIFYVTLEQKYIHQHTIGRFRITSTGAPDPVASGVPEDIEKLLLETNPDNNARATLHQYFLEHTPLLAKAQAEIASLEKSLPRQPTTLALEEREEQRVTNIHHRGEFLQPKAAVQPDVPEVLPRLPEFAPRNRLTLARWIMNEDNPLTARVTMNRLWQQFFGRGIVRTAEDFGVQGEAPSHPALLDWLAVEFMRRGWSMKDMARLIVTSKTYRQSARVTPEQLQIDPQNVYLARAPRFRVDAEFVRDIALAASGSLNPAVGGPSVFPPLPEGLLDMVYGGSSWKADEGDARQRRGMYTYWKRMLTYPTAAVFDAPARDMVCVRRLRTNTPMQALTLLNDEVFMDAARTMARSLLAETPSDPAERLRQLFLRCMAREPDALEQQALLSYLDSQTALLRKQPVAQVAELLNAPGAAGEAPVEAAAWTLLCRAVLNLDETITRG